MTNPIHVFVVNVYFAPYTYGGATVVAEQVAKHLKTQHGFQVTAISAMSRADLAAYSVIKSQVDGITNYLINLPFGRPYEETYTNSRVTEVLSELMRSEAPDVVHLHCLQDVGSGVIAAAKRQNLPVILSTHDFWWLCERQFMIRMDGNYCTQDPIDINYCKGCVENLSKAMIRHETLVADASQADLLTFPSAFAKDISERSGLTAKQSVVWGNGVKLPDTRFFELQKTRRETKKRLSFGFVGGPSQIKGWPIIRKAFAMLKTDIDFDVFLVEGSLDGSWWRDVDFCKLPGSWHVTPKFSQNDMDDYYAKIDVLLFMSQWRETFGLSIREALSRGIRVIQTNSGGTTEHARADSNHMPEIGDGPERLLREIEYEITRATSHPEPLDVTSFADQAEEMAAHIKSLV